MTRSSWETASDNELRALLRQRDVDDTRSVWWVATRRSETSARLIDAVLQPGVYTEGGH